MQQNIAPPLIHVEAERAFDLISICRGERGGTRNTHRPDKQRARRRIFSALDQPNRATWRMAAGCYILDKAADGAPGDVEVVTFVEAVRRYAGLEKGEVPTRDQMFFTLEVLSRLHP